MLALREEHLDKWRYGPPWDERPAVDPDAPMMVGLGHDAEERCWMIFADGTAREAVNYRPAWTRDRLDGERDWRFVDDDTPVPPEAKFWWLPPGRRSAAPARHS
ncbi:MAG TPA: hypothetical protein VE623_21095 [Acidimicrobiales bacterium]|jgi:hypothetical protein|nr:hypothetical protein [Acidimicrobiales bacterium]